MGEQATLIDVPPHAGDLDDNQRYTTPAAMAWVRTVAGVIAFDLDAAACEESHHAPDWYGPQLLAGGMLFLDGLTQPWFGHTFVNPPWDDIGPWVLRAWQQFVQSPTLKTVAMLLPGNRTHRPWWQNDVEPFRDGRANRSGIVSDLTVHFAPERFAYGHPGNPRGIGCGEPNFTSVLLVWRRA